MKIAIGGVRGIPASYGGFETSADETAQRLQQRGHEVKVYCRSRQRGANDTTFGGIKLIHLSAFPVNFLETIVHSISVGLHVAFRERDVDVVHLYNAASAVGGVIVRLAGKPLIMTLDGVEWKREKWNGLARMIWKISTWLAVRVANTVVCDSQTVRSLFEKRYNIAIRHIPYGAKSFDNVSDVYRSFGLENQRYFIFVGRLVPEKSVDVLIDAYNELGTDIPLVIVGDNENDPEYVWMLRNRARANVHFLGYRYGNEYESLLSHARAYITASKLEGTSPSLLAAMGARVCCLVNAIPENKETGSDCVLYFDGSTSDLVAKWRALLKHPETIEQFAAKGNERVRSHYDWDAVTTQYLATYGEITAQGKALTISPCVPSQIDRD
jgi:glycosyltransferase involved in cell wall biosynthesis